MDDLGGQMITVLVQGLFFLVGGGFGVVGAGLMLLGLLAIWQDVRVRSWPTVPGIIRHAVVESRVRSETMTSHHARILYDYEVGGRQYAGDRLAFSRRASRRAAEADKAKYPPGKLVRVYYDPKRPRRAVLETRAGIAGTLILLFVGAMLLGGATVAIWGGIEVGRA